MFRLPPLSTTKKFWVLQRILAGNYVVELDEKFPHTSFSGALPANDGNWIQWKLGQNLQIDKRGHLYTKI